MIKPGVLTCAPAHGPGNMREKTIMSIEGAFSRMTIGVLPYS